MNSGWGISYEIALRWMPLDLTDDKSTLVQVMAWCRQATSHYLSQCWPRSLSPYGVTRPQWVKLKSCEISFAHNIHFNCRIILKFYTEHGNISISISAMLCAKFQNDWSTEAWFVDKHDDFVRFGFKMHIGRTSIIAWDPQDSVH